MILLVFYVLDIDFAVISLNMKYHEILKLKITLILKEKIKNQPTTTAYGNEEMKTS